MPTRTVFRKGAEYQEKELPPYCQQSPALRTPLGRQCGLHSKKSGGMGVRKGPSPSVLKPTYSWFLIRMNYILIATISHKPTPHHFRSCLFFSFLPKINNSIMSKANGMTWPCRRRLIIGLDFQGCATCISVAIHVNIQVLSVWWELPKSWVAKVYINARFKKKMF